jgi:CRISPR system Cascade subunit CasC
MPARFLQFHTLTSYPAALLNRDDAGFAKRLPFGGWARTRISSQCLKRHWRTFTGDHSIGRPELGAGVSTRSRDIFEKIIKPKLIGEGLADEVAAAIALALKIAVLKGEKGLKGGEKPKKGKKGKPDADESDKAEAADEGDIESQVIPIGPAEVAFLVKLGVATAAKAKDLAGAKAELLERLGDDGFANLRALKANAGIDAALFGRMVTSDILSRCDAAVHVAHAFTVHADAVEADYFSAVDDLRRGDGELGAGHINSTELTSGLYYGYVAVDVPLLVANLTGCDVKEWERADRSLAAKVVHSLVHLIATVSPGAKLGSTAPYSFAHLMLVEAGSRQPCTLANAFVEPVDQRGDLIGNAYAAVAQEACDLDWNFPGKPARAHLLRGQGERSKRLQIAVPDTKGSANPQPGDLGERLNLEALAGWAQHQVH